MTLIMPPSILTRRRPNAVMLSSIFCSPRPLRERGERAHPDRRFISRPVFVERVRRIWRTKRNCRRQGPLLERLYHSLEGDHSWIIFPGAFVPENARSSLPGRLLPKPFNTRAHRLVSRIEQC